MGSDYEGSVKSNVKAAQESAWSRAAGQLRDALKHQQELNEELATRIKPIFIEHAAPGEKRAEDGAASCAVVDELLAAAAKVRDHNSILRYLIDGLQC